MRMPTDKELSDLRATSTADIVADCEQAISDLESLADEMADRIRQTLANLDNLLGVCSV